MLTYLQIRDFAIIDAIELELRPGLTVLTGETGAGKSILVDALQLLAGGRAGPEVVRHGAERAEITGTFDLHTTPRELKRWLEAQSINAGEELTVRRVVASDGRSRGYINGQAVAIQLLREAGHILIDIHGQHEFQSLTRAAAQRDLLDGYGRLEPATGQVGIAHRIWLELLNRTLETEGRARDRDSKLELLRYQVTELNALQLKEGEVGSLAEERARLSNRGKLAEATQTALQLLYEGEDGRTAHAGVSRALQVLRGLTAVDPKLGIVVPLVAEAEIQIREAARELAHYRDGLDVDTARQDLVEKRLAAIEDLARRHRTTPPELATRAGVLALDLETLERAELDLAVLRRDLAAALENYRTLATQLSAKRSTAGRALAKDITTRMQTLGMSGGRFQVEVAQEGTAEPSQHGLDQIDFRVTANPGQPLRPLSKVASGGELSRLSLAVQVSAARETRCMVFDEVDTGIGGAVAEIVGRELRALAEHGQVLCVTHLPQVASQGHHHLRVTKVTDGRTTRTALTELAADARVEELARMLGGIEITAKAREHAREMLKVAAPDASSTVTSATGGDAQEAPTGSRRARPAAKRR